MGYTPKYSHLVGIMISKTIGFFGVHNIFRQTQMDPTLIQLASFSTGVALQVWQHLLRAAVPHIRHVALRLALRIFGGRLDHTGVDQDHVDVEQMLRDSMLHLIRSRLKPAFEELVHLRHAMRRFGSQEFLLIQLEINEYK